MLPLHLADESRFIHQIFIFFLLFFQQEGTDGFCFGNSIWLMRGLQKRGEFNREEQQRGCFIGATPGFFVATISE